MALDGFERLRRAFEPRILEIQEETEAEEALLAERTQADRRGAGATSGTSGALAVLGGLRAQAARLESAIRKSSGRKPAARKPADKMKEKGKGGTGPKPPAQARMAPPAALPAPPVPPAKVPVAAPPPAAQAPSPARSPEAGRPRAETIARGKGGLADADPSWNEPPLAPAKEGDRPEEAAALNPSPPPRRAATAAGISAAIFIDTSAGMRHGRLASAMQVVRGPILARLRAFEERNPGALEVAVLCFDRGKACLLRPDWVPFEPGAFLALLADARLAREADGDGPLLEALRRANVLHERARRTRREIVLLAAGDDRGGPDAAAALAREVRRASAGRVGLHVLGFRARDSRYGHLRDAGGKVVFIDDAAALRAALERIIPATPLERG